MVGAVSGTNMDNFSNSTQNDNVSGLDTMRMFNLEPIEKSSGSGYTMTPPGTTSAKLKVYATLGPMSLQVPDGMPLYMDKGKPNDTEWIFGLVDVADISKLPTAWRVIRNPPESTNSTNNIGYALKHKLGYFGLYNLVYGPTNNLGDGKCIIYYVTLTQTDDDNARTYYYNYWASNVSHVSQNKHPFAKNNGKNMWSTFISLKPITSGLKYADMSHPIMNPFMIPHLNKYGTYGNYKNKIFKINTEGGTILYIFIKDSQYVNSVHSGVMTDVLYDVISRGYSYGQPVYYGGDKTIGGSTSGNALQCSKICTERPYGSGTDPGCGWVDFNATLGGDNVCQYLTYHAFGPEGGSEVPTTSCNYCGVLKKASGFYDWSTESSNAYQAYPSSNHKDAAISSYNPSTVRDKILSEKIGTSLDGCRQLCDTTASCNAFSYGQDGDGWWPGHCVLIKDDKAASNIVTSDAHLLRTTYVRV